MKIINVLIAGVGGQGVNTASIALQNACIKEGFYCKSSIFKGGAQKRGSIYSIIRIFPIKDLDVAQMSGELASETLHLLVALEYWESLRYINKYSNETNLIINREEIPFFSERYSNNKAPKPASQILEQRFNKTTFKEYSKISSAYFNDRRMANFIMVIDGIRNGTLPISEITFCSEFINQIKVNDQVKKKMKDYVNEKLK